MKSKLAEIIEEFRASKDPSVISKLEAEVRLYSKEDRQIFTIVNEEGEIAALNADGNLYFPIFTDEEFIQAKNGKVISCSFNKVIKELFTDISMSGLVINPFSQNQFVDTITLIKAVFGQTIKFESVTKDWGKGIPEYKEEDVLSKERSLYLALNVFNQLSSQKNIKLWFYTNEADMCPNVIIKENDRYAFVYVEVDSDINMPSLSKEKKEELLNRAKQFGFNCYYASFGLYSNDQERQAKGLLLIGDNFGIKFNGLSAVTE